MRFKRASAVALLTAFVPAPVAAQTPIRADSGKTFKHRPSGIVVAAAAAGIPRVSVVEYDDKQLDVAADFRTPDQSEITTVFIFRKVTGDVPLWFDRIEHVVAAKPELASPTLSIPPTAFTPLGQPNSRGLIAVFTAGRGPWKSSAAALTTIGDWFVAVRASSQTLPAEQLLGRLEQTFSALSWPREKVMAPVAVPVRACPTALPQPAEDAAPVEEDGPGLLLNALIPAVPASSPDEESAVHRWCRDPLNLPDAGVYRPEEALDRYLVAFQD
jgi:hypothetical protein